MADDLTVDDGRIYRPKQRGARKSPRHKLLAAVPFRQLYAAPPQFALVPARLDMWGNDQYGDCVSAEEAFAKACYLPEVFIDARTVVDWAARRGFRDGADLAEVLDAMREDGFKVGSQQYNDGQKLGVDYTNQEVLRAAISSAASAGPVKIAIDADALPQGAGNKSGWYAFGRGNYRNTDHCTALSGYGTAAYCFGVLGVPVPSGVDPNKPDCYLHYTWNTIGVVDHPWLLGTCTEAWTRTPTTVGVPPLTPPVPPTPPVPVPPGPPPTPTPGGSYYSMAIDSATGVITFSPTSGPLPTGAVVLTPAQVAQIESLLHPTA